MAKALRIIIASLIALTLVGTAPLPAPSRGIDFQTSGPEPPEGG